MVGTDRPAIAPVARILVGNSENLRQSTSARAPVCDGILGDLRQELRAGTDDVIVEFVGRIVHRPAILRDRPIADERVRPGFVLGRTKIFRSKDS